ncbi:polyprotein [Posavirus sp.]|nr:polyprotein [Posavirus sp.]
MDYSMVTSELGCCDDDIGKFVRPEFCKCDIVFHKKYPRVDVSIRVKSCLSINDPSVDGFDTDFFYLPDLYTFIQGCLFLVEEFGQEGELVLDFEDIYKFVKTYNNTHLEMTWISLLPQLCVALDASKIYEDVGVLKCDSSVACFSDVETASIYFYWKNVAISAYNNGDYFRSLIAMFNMWDLLSAFTDYDTSKLLFIDVLNIDPICCNISPEGITDTISNFFKGWAGKTKATFSSIVKKCVDSCLGLVQQWLSESVWKNLSEAIYGFLDSVIDPFHLLDDLFDKLCAVWKKEDDTAALVDKKHTAGDYGLRWGRLVCKFIVVIVTVILGVLTYANWDNLMAVVGISKTEATDGPIVPEGTNSFASDFITVLSLALTPILGSSCKDEHIDLIQLTRDAMSFTNFGKTVGNAFVAALNVLPDCLSGILCPIFGDEKQKVAYYTNAMISRSDVILEYSKVSSIYSQQGFKDELADTLRWAQPIMKSYATNSAMNEFRNRYNLLCRISQQLTVSQNMKTPRNIPFWIHIAARPGVGKSTSCRYIIDYILENFEIGHRKLHGVWYRCPADPFYTAYQGQEVVVWDEFLNEADPKKLAEDMNEMLSICSSTPYFPPLPSVDDGSSVGVKGTPFRPVVIITMNNNLSVNSDKEDIEIALMRRRNMCIVVQPNPAYADKFDFEWHFDTSKADESAIVSSGNHLLFEFYNKNCFVIREPNEELNIMHPGVVSYNNLFGVLKFYYDNHVKVNSLFNPNVEDLLFDDAKKVRIGNHFVYETNIADPEAGRTFVEGDKVIVLKRKCEHIPEGVTEVDVVMNDGKKCVTFIDPKTNKQVFVDIDLVIGSLGIVKNRSRLDILSNEPMYDESRGITDHYLEYRFGSRRYLDQDTINVYIAEFCRKYQYHKFTSRDLDNMRLSLSSLLQVKQGADIYYYFDLTKFNGWGYYLFEFVNEKINNEDLTPVEQIVEKVEIAKTWVMGSDTNEILFKTFGIKLVYIEKEDRVELWLPREFENYCRFYPVDAKDENFKTYVLDAPCTDEPNGDKVGRFKLHNYHRWLLNAISIYYTAKGTKFSSTYKRRPEVCKNLFRDYISYYMVPAMEKDKAMAGVPAFKVYGTLNPKFTVNFYKNDQTYDLKLHNVFRIDEDKQERILPCIGSSVKGEIDYEDYFTRFSLGLYAKYIKDNNKTLGEFYEDFVADDWLTFFYRFGITVDTDDLISSGIDLRATPRVLDAGNALAILGLIDYKLRGDVPVEDDGVIDFLDDVDERVDDMKKKRLLNSFDLSDNQIFNAGGITAANFKNITLSGDVNEVCQFVARVYCFRLNNSRLIVIANNSHDDLMNFLGSSFQYKMIEFTIPAEVKAVGSVAWNYSNNYCAIVVEDITKISDHNKIVLRRMCNIGVPKLKFYFHRFFSWFKDYLADIKVNVRALSVGKMLDTVFGPQFTDLKHVADCEGISLARAWGSKIGHCVATASIITSIGYFLWTRNSKKDECAPILPEDDDSPTKAQASGRSFEMMNLRKESEMVISGAEIRRKLKSARGLPAPEAYQYVDVYFSGPNFEGRGIAVANNHIITHYHSVANEILSATDNPRVTVTVYNSGKRYTGSVDPDSLKMIPNYDLCSFVFDCINWNPIRENLSCFLSKADFFNLHIAGNNRKGFIKLDDYRYTFDYYYSQAKIHYDFTPVTDNETRTVYLSEYLLYNVNSQNGWCGSVVLTNRQGSTPAIVGMHVAGQNLSTGHCAYATILYREKVEALIGIRNLDETVVQQVSGKITPESKNVMEISDCPSDWRYFVPSTSKYHLSIVGEDEVFDNPVEPAILTKKDYRAKGVDPFEYGLNQLMNNEQVKVDGDLLKRVKNELIEKFHKDNAIRMPPRVLTLDEAISGIAGFLSPMNSKSGLGYPSSAYYSSKKRDMFDHAREEVINPHFRADMEDYIKKWNNGEIREIFVEAYLKDELQKLSKIEEVRTRLTFCFDTRFNIMTRMRFGYALGVLVNMHNEYGSGINPCSKELDYYIYKYLSEVANGDKKCFIAGDYKAFDIHMQSAFKEAAYDVIYSFLEQFISREEWDRFVYLSSHPWVRIHNKMYKFVSANFSGNVFTTVLNNIVNSLMIRYIYYLEHDKYKYDEVVRGVFCGDDHVLCVDRSKVEFSGKDLARLMPTLNQVYTSDIKDAEIEDYREFKDISFLGCIPKLIDGYYVGALKKSTLESHINWVRDDEVFDAVVDAFVMYAAVHGLEYYQEYCQKIISCYIRRGKRFYFRPYESTVYMLVNNLSGNALPTIESNVTTTFSKPVEIGVPAETAYINPSQMNNSEDVGAVATNYLWKDDFRWSTTHAKGAVIYSRTIYDLVSSKTTDVQATMFRQFMYFSSDFSIRVMTNGNAFQQGMLRLVYVPYNDTYNFNYTDLMNFNGINILPTGSGDLCLDIPFTYNTALARCVPKYKSDVAPTNEVSNVQSLGSIHFVVLSPLAYTSGQDVSMSIYLALQNPNFQIPVPYIVPESNVSQAPNPVPPPIPTEATNADLVKENPSQVKTQSEISKFKLHKRLAYRNKGKRQNKRTINNLKGKPMGRKRSDLKGDVRKGPKFTKDERRAYAKKMYLKNQYLRREFLRGEGDLTAYAGCEKKNFFLKKKKKFSAAWDDVTKILMAPSDKKVEDIVTMLSATMVNGFGLGANFIGPVCDKIENMAHVFLKSGSYEPTPEFIESVMSVGKLLMFFDKPMDFDLDSFVPKYPSMSNAITAVPTYSMQLDPSAIQGKGRAVLGGIDTNIQSLLSKSHLFQFNWANTDATLTSKLSFPCNSLLSDSAPSDNACSVPIFVLNHFKYWSSDIQLKFHFVKTPFHTGRLRVICGYGCYGVSEAQAMRTTSFTTIINISDEDDNKTVVIPYVSMFDMLETAYSNKTGWNHGDTNSFGYVVIEVANVLSTSVSNIKPSIDVLVEASFINSRVCVPRSISLFDTTPSSIGIKPESFVAGEVAIEQDGDSVEVDVHDDDIESHAESEEIAIQAGMAPEFDETNAHQVTTIYEVLRRYQLLSEVDYSYSVNNTKNVGNLFVSTNFNFGLSTLFITQTGGLNYRIFIGAGSRLLVNYVPRYYGRNSYKYLTNVGNIPSIKPVVGYGVTASNLHTNHPVERSYLAGNEGWVDVHLPYQSIVDFAVYDSYGELSATIINDNGKVPSYIEVWISAGDDFTVGNFLPPKHYYVTGVSNTTKDSLMVGDILA